VICCGNLCRREADSEGLGEPPVHRLPQDQAKEDHAEASSQLPKHGTRHAVATHCRQQTNLDILWQLTAGEKPTLKDWENHLSTIFPEIRLKKIIQKLHLNYPNMAPDMLWQLTAGKKSTLTYCGNSLQERSQP